MSETLSKPPMESRVLSRVEDGYVPAEYKGNTSGYLPLGKNVLVLMDEFAEQRNGLIFTAETRQRMELASESGVIIALGPQAFHVNYDGTRWTGYRPAPGDRVYCERYAGVLIAGKDGKQYRVMTDNCIGAVAHDEQQQGAKHDAAG